MSNYQKPIILEQDGVLGQLPDGGIVNIGGTVSPTFTLNGRGLAYDDGTSTGGTGDGITLQDVYNNSPTVGGAARIHLTTGKNFEITDDTDASLFFRVDSTTGKVTITGDLEVLGGSSIINTVVQDSDHWLISPKLGTTTPLRIEPDLGVTPIVDLVSVRRTFGTAPVFRIDSAGNLYATLNLTVGGLINGVDIVQLRSDLDSHLAGDIENRHLAGDIDILPIATLPGATNVQEALEQINIKIDNNGGGGGGGAGTAGGYEHVQATADTIWTIVHNASTFRCQVTVYDEVWEQILPDLVKIIDNNTIMVAFSAAVAGRAMVFFF